MNTHFQVRVICTDKCISEIPRIFRKNIIGYRILLYFIYSLNGAFSISATSSHIFKIEQEAAFAADLLNICITYNNT